MHASLRTIFLGGQTDWHDNLIALWRAQSPAPRVSGHCILIPFGLGVCPCSVSPLGKPVEGSTGHVGRWAESHQLQMPPGLVGWPH